MFTKILHANDGSDRAFKALLSAIELAKHFGSELHMICVEEMPNFPTTIDELVEEKTEADHRYGPVVHRARELARGQGVALAAHVVSGHPVQRIVKFVQDEGCDLLVIGFMGHSALYERVIGGTADRLVRLSPCAVVVIK
jgi:nucleotide-binding universal stress UspA family protein